MPPKTEPEPMKTNRDKFIELRAQLEMTEKEVAAFLSKETNRPVGYRTVQSWSNDPENEHSRRCQDWVIELLQAELHRRSKSGKK